MIFHAVSMVAFFMDQLAFEPVQIQCVSNAGQDPILVRLLFDAVPSIFALGIAALVFYWSSGREHKRWILDQKKVEWGKLFNEFTEAKKEFLPIYKDEKTAQLFLEKWDEMEQRIDFIAMPCIFIAQKLIDIEFYQAWEDFKNKASINNTKMLERIKNRFADRLYGHIEGDPIQSLYCDLENEFNRIIVAMRNCAEADLDIMSPVKSKWYLAALQRFVRIKQPFRGPDKTVQDQPSATEE